MEVIVAATGNLHPEWLGEKKEKEKSSISSNSGVQLSRYVPSIPRHSFLSCTILLAYPTFEPLFFKQSFTESIHLFEGRPTKGLPLHNPTYTLLAIRSSSFIQ